MPYYDGRWHRYSEAEKREFGQRERARESDKWHKKWISKAGLKERLWTDKAIGEFLGKPQDTGPIKAWTREEVEAAEKTKGFKNWLEERKAWLTARGKLELSESASQISLGKAPSSPLALPSRVGAKRRGGFALQQVKASLKGAVFDALSLDIL